MVHEAISKIKILLRLKLTKGLYKPRKLSNKEIKLARKLNSPENVGIEEVLNKKNVFIVYHDSSFRKPQKQIVKKYKNKILFPPIPFKEIKGSISASPDKKLHIHLSKKTKIKKDWASLLIGVK